MEKPLPQLARIIKDERDSGMGYTNADVAIDLIVNARGRACMMHDRPFVGTPVWVKYLTNKRKVKLVFDNGTEFVYDHIMTGPMHKALLNVTKLFIIQINNGVPVEGYDTTLIKE